MAAGLAEEALRWSLAAGDEAMRVFAVRAAIAHYEQARRIRDSDGYGLPAAKGSRVVAPSDLLSLSTASPSSVRT